MEKARLPATERVRYEVPTTGGWIIPSEAGDKQLAPFLLPSMTQDQLAEYSTKERFHAKSLPEHFELFNDLYELRNNGGEVEKAREFIRSSLRKSPIRLTRILYQPKGPDTIVHGYGTSSKRKEKIDLVGPDGNVLEVLSEEASLALTGKSPEQVAELLGYINRTKVLIWRLNSKPKSVDESVVGFDAGSSRAVLNCSGYPQYSNSSLGVRFRTP